MFVRKKNLHSGKTNIEKLLQKAPTKIYRPGRLWINKYLSATNVTNTPKSQLLKEMMFYKSFRDEELPPISQGKKRIIAVGSRAKS